MNGLSGSQKSRGRLVAVFLLYLLIILIAGLWPFNFLAENGIPRSRDGNCLSLNGHGIMLSQEQESGSLLALFTDKAITMELWVKPATEPTNGVPIILAMYDVHSRQSFSVGQWRSHLIVRTMTERPMKDKHNYREIGLREALVPAREHFITVTSDAEGTALYLEGNAARTYEKYSVFCEASGVGQMVVGNSPTGKQGWSGDLLGLAIYNRSLGSDEVFQSYARWKEGSRESLQLKNTVALYSFNEGTLSSVRNRAIPGLDLLVPGKFAPPQRSVLSWSWDYGRHRWSSIQDILVNIAGFMPFGLLATALLARRHRLSAGVSRKSLAGCASGGNPNPVPPMARCKPNASPAAHAHDALVPGLVDQIELASFSRNSGWPLLPLATLLGFALSLSMEWLQAYLPSRDSSLIDVACNALGTALGAAACVWDNARKSLLRWLCMSP